MLKAYFDESCHPSEHRVMAVGGALAPLSAWEALGEKWRKALDDAGVPFFRMSKFEHYEKPFAWTKERHEEFLKYLLDIMNEYVDFYVGGCLLARDDSRSLGEEFEPDHRAVPYFHCFIHSMSAAHWLTFDRYRKETAQLVFAEQEEFGRQAMIWFSKHREVFPELYHNVESAAFAPYEKTEQLQAADLVAYTLTRHLKNQLDRKSLPYYPWQRIHEKPCHFMGLESTVNWEAPPLNCAS